MSDHQEAMFDANVAMARRLNRSAAEKYAQKGLHPAQIAEAAVLSAFDIAEVLHKGDGVAALEYIRTAIDAVERGVWDGNRA